MNHRREGESRQKRKIDDQDNGPNTGENDLLRGPRRRLENSLDKVSSPLMDVSVSGQRANDSGKATPPIVVTVPDAGQTLEW